MIDAKYFDRLYASNIDPWDYTTSTYEARKYAATLAALPRMRFNRGFEPGCSIGILTRMLAARCGHLVAADISDAPLVAARAHCRGLPNITFRRMRVPDEWPRGTFDLIVLSEVLYYLSNTGVTAIARRATQSLRPGGVVTLVHWLGETGTARSGDQAVQQFIRQARRRLRVLARRRHPLYRLDVLAR